MFCIVQDKLYFDFDVEFENSNTNYQTFQRNILYFSFQRKSNSKILQGKHVKMCN